MKCVILVAGHAVQLEEEIKADLTGTYTHLVGVPALVVSF